MTTGSERGAIPTVFQWLSARNLQLTVAARLTDTLGGVVEFPILTKLLLLDEPFEGVAPALAHRLVEVVVDLKREGMSVILSESDLQHSERMVDQIIVIDRGAITSVE